MNTSTIILIVVLAIMIIALIVLYFLGKKAQARQAEQQAQMDAAAMTVAMTIIDKKRMRIKDAGFPEMVTSQVPWYAKNTKLPIVKAKVGPKITNLICDADLFEILPVRKEVKATVSGLYITSVKGLHGYLEMDKPAKKGFMAKLRAKQKEAAATLNADKAAKDNKKKKGK